jgi:hypothetical protein
MEGARYGNEAVGRLQDHICSGDQLLEVELEMLQSSVVLVANAA